MSQYPEVEIHIMRTAAELWKLAGPDMWLYKWSGHGHAMLQGKADRCSMTREEFTKYQEMRGKWQAAGQDLASQDLAGAPSVSMLEATADEEAELEALRRRQPSSFARAFNVMESLLLAHQASLDEEDREEMLRRLAGQMLSLKEAVLRAEEIWTEEQGAGGREQGAERREHELSRDELLKRALDTADLLQNAQEHLEQQRREIEALRRTVKRQEMSISALMDAGDSLGLSCKALDEEGWNSVQAWGETKAAVARVTKGGNAA